LQLPDGEMIKLDREVQFPLDSLDMSPFVFHSGQTPTPIRKNSQQVSAREALVSSVCMAFAASAIGVRERRQSRQFETAIHECATSEQRVDISLPYNRN
jgi:hypothetical protein